MAAGFYPFLILNALDPRPEDDAGLYRALVWVHYGQILLNAFFSILLTYGETPLSTNYICRSFVKSY